MYFIRSNWTISFTIGWKKYVYVLNEFSVLLSFMIHFALIKSWSVENGIITGIRIKVYTIKFFLYTECTH